MMKRLEHRGRGGSSTILSNAGRNGYYESIALSVLICRLFHEPMLL